MGMNKNKCPKLNFLLCVIILHTCVMYMYICTYTYVYTCTYTHVYVCVHICTLHMCTYSVYVKFDLFINQGSSQRFY